MIPARVSDIMCWYHRVSVVSCVGTIEGQWYHVLVPSMWVVSWYDVLVPLSVSAIMCWYYQGLVLSCVGTIECQ